jgi:hypothetical protein
VTPTYPADRDAGRHPKPPTCPATPISATQVLPTRDGWVAPVLIAQMVPPIFFQLGQMGGWHRIPPNPYGDSDWCHSDLYDVAIGGWHLNAIGGWHLNACLMWLGGRGRRGVVGILTLALAIFDQGI